MRYVFDEVRAEFMSKVNTAKSSGLSFEVYDFEQIHYWNWPISKYNNQAIDPSNLFPATKNMYEIIHNMPTSGSKKFVPFSYFHPIAEKNTS